jgi:hypothetical protein
MTLGAVSRSLRRKVLLLVLAATAIALGLSALGLVIYDLRAYERQWTNDLNTQAELLARTSAAALSFGDRETATRDLAVLKVRPRVMVAAIYTRDGELFATYAKPDVANPAFPAEGPRPTATASRVTSSSSTAASSRAASPSAPSICARSTCRGTACATTWESCSRS